MSSETRYYVLVLGFLGNKILGTSTRFPITKDNTGLAFAGKLQAFENDSSLVGLGIQDPPTLHVIVLYRAHVLSQNMDVLYRDTKGLISRWSS